MKSNNINKLQKWQFVDLNNKRNSIYSLPCLVSARFHVHLFFFYIMYNAWSGAV